MTARTRKEKEAPPSSPATRQVPIVLPTESSRCLGATMPAYDIAWPLRIPPVPGVGN